MKPWVTACAVCVLASITLAACTVIRSIHQTSPPSPERASEAQVRDIHYSESTKHMQEAMDQLGFKQSGFVGEDWGGVACNDQTYFVQLEEEPSFFFTRDLTTGRMETITIDQVELQLRRYISYRGKLTGARFHLDSDPGGIYFWLGDLPDSKLPTFVYVRFDRTACGLVADRVWYRGTSGNETTPVHIQLLPIPKSNG